MIKIIKSVVVLRIHDTYICVNHATHLENVLLSHSCFLEDGEHIGQSLLSLLLHTGVINQLSSLGDDAELTAHVNSAIVLSGLAVGSNGGGSCEQQGK